MRIVEDAREAQGLVRGPIAGGPRRDVPHQRPPREDHGQKQSGGECRPAVSDKEQRERQRGEKSADGRPDAHAEVDGKAIECDRGLALIGADERRQRGKACGAARFRDHRPDEREREKECEVAHEREREQDGARGHERAAQDGEGAESIAEAAGDWAADQAAETVDRERYPGEREADAEELADVEDHEGDDHAAGAIDQRRREHDPDRCGKTGGALPWIGLEHELAHQADKLQRPTFWDCMGTHWLRSDFLRVARTSPYCLVHHYALVSRACRSPGPRVTGLTPPSSCIARRRCPQSTGSCIVGRADSSLFPVAADGRCARSAPAARAQTWRGVSSA